MKKLEWSMGNGQCPECCGVPASWHGQPGHMTTDTIGHEAECPLAAALRDAGETPLMKGDFTSNVEFEHYISESGFFGTRPKTEHGTMMLIGENYKPGDPAPKGYLAWHAWAEVQHKAGLRQKQCGRCGLWKYPQELSDQLERNTLRSKNGEVVVIALICLDCVTPNVEVMGAAPHGKETK